MSSGSDCSIQVTVGEGYHRQGSVGYLKHGAPDVNVSWFHGFSHVSVTVGDTTTDDHHAARLLRNALDDDGQQAGDEAK